MTAPWCWLPGETSGACSHDSYCLTCSPNPSQGLPKNNYDWAEKWRWERTKSTVDSTISTATLPLCEEEKVKAPMIPWSQNENEHFPTQASSALSPTREGYPASSTSAFQQHIALFCGQNKVRRAGLCGLKWLLHPCHDWYQPTTATRQCRR